MDTPLIERPINLDKMNSLAMGIYNLYNMKNSMKKYSFDQDAPFRDRLLNSITTAMDGDSLYEASLELQPLEQRTSPPTIIRRSNSDTNIVLAPSIEPEEPRAYSSRSATLTEQRSNYSLPSLFSPKLFDDGDGDVDLPDLDQL